MSIYLQELLSVKAIDTNDSNVEPRIIEGDREEVELIISGNAIYSHQGKESEVGPNHIIWLKSGEKTLKPIPSQSPFESLVITFKVSTERKRPVSPVSIWQSQISAAKFRDEACHAWKMKNNSNSEFLRDYLYHSLLWNAKIGQPQSEQEQHHFAISLSFQFINDNFDKDISIEDIAKHSKVSSSHLFSLFKKHLQKSPHQVLMDRRLSEAKERLKYTDHLIKEISSACGFSNVIVFCRSFRKACGMTPTEYRFSFRSHY